MLRRHALVLAAACSFVAAAAAQAQDDVARARAAFERAVAAYSDAQYEEALLGFRRAHELSGAPELLYNIGQCLERLGRPAEAIEAYEAYLAAQPQAEDTADVEARIAVLRASIAAEAEREPVDEPPTTAPPAGETNVLEEWWLWTIVAVVVAAGVGVGIGVGVATQAAPPPGDLGPGGVIFALGGSLP